MSHTTKVSWPTGVAPYATRAADDEDLLNDISDALAACSGLLASSGKVCRQSESPPAAGRAVASPPPPHDTS